MFYLEKLIRPSLFNLKPYSSARDEFSGSEGIFLDANENPFGKLNRYPDPHQSALKKKISEVKSVAAENIFVGNGSDEVIDLIFRLFCVPGKDKALTFTPTYGMYDVSAAINDVELIKLPLNDSFQIDENKLEGYLNDEDLKLIFICSPNNPTGNNIENITGITSKFKGIVVIDEAYIDFSEAMSFSKSINEYKNIIVMQTLSKAWGLAAARVGMAFADTSIIQHLDKIKPPYNVSGLNQEAAINALNNRMEFEKQKECILSQRSFLQEELIKVSCVKKIYPTDANFILAEMTDADKIYNELVNKKVITRNRNSVVKNCIRITVGSPEENKILIKTLNETAV
jgi:histidinol-phosphate aminotransferase